MRLTERLPALLLALSIVMATVEIAASLAVCAGFIGVIVGVYNQMNLRLSGSMDSMVHAPISNGGALLLTVLASALVFKEKPTSRRLLGFAVGLASIVTLSLTLIFALMLVTSCGGEAQSESTDTSASADTTTSVENMDGYVFSIVGQSTADRQNFYLEDRVGKGINYAILEHDSTVEQRLGIELEYTSYDSRADAANAVINTVLSDEQAYDLCITAMAQGINTMTSANVLLNLKELPYISLESKYRDKSISENMHFNVRLAEEYLLGDIYEVVLDGKWTVDLMDKVNRDVSRELNSDGVMDVDDFYGTALDVTFGNVLYRQMREHLRQYRPRLPQHEIRRLVAAGLPRGTFGLRKLRHARLAEIPRDGVRFRHHPDTEARGAAGEVLLLDAGRAPERNRVPLNFRARSRATTTRSRATTP